MTDIAVKNVAGLVCVELEVHIWSGRRHLEREDLLAAHPSLSKLPTETLATLGAYKICDPKDIKRFQQIKGRAERYVQRAGLPVSKGSWGVPAAKYEAVDKELEAFEAEFQTATSEFLAKYDQAIQTWQREQLVQNPDYRHLFNSVPASEHVARKLSFAFHAYRLGPPGGTDVLNERFNNRVGGLKGELLKEVAAEATTLIDDYLYKKDDAGVAKVREYVLPKTLGPLRRAAQKLDDFRFLDPSIGPLADIVAEVVVQAGADRIEGASLMKVWALAQLLSDPARAVEVAAASMEGAHVDDLLNTMSMSHAIPARAVAAPPVPAPLELLDGSNPAGGQRAEAGLSLLL